MKYLHTYDSYKKVNEEFLGGLMKKLKNKLSLSLSKNFGSASDADAVIEGYKKEAMQAYAKKEANLKSLGDYLKQLKGNEADKDRIKELKREIAKSTENYKNQLEIIKKKFDVKFNEIVEGEENKKITNYIKLKKLEMEQELLNHELQVLQQGGVSEEFIKSDPDFANMIKGINSRMQESQKEAQLQKEEITKESEKKVGFDMDAAKAAAKAEGEEYNWSKGKFSNGQHEFKKGEQILYFSNTNYKDAGDSYNGTKATVIDVNEDSIRIKTDTSEVNINKGKVIKSYEDEQEEE